MTQDQEDTKALEALTEEAVQNNSTEEFIEISKEATAHEREQMAKGGVLLPAGQVSNEQMKEDIEKEEEFTPIPEDDVDAIRAAIIKARINEIPKDCKFDEDDKENEKLVERSKKYHEEMQKQIDAMTDEELIAWAKDANQKYKTIIKDQKEHFSDLSCGRFGPASYKESDWDNFSWDKVEAWMKDRKEKSKANSDKLRRHFLRITNPKRKRGNPIAKEPEQYHRFLNLCKDVRGKMDFDKMSKMEIKTRLIQTIAAEAINISNLQEKYSNELNANYAALQMSREDLMQAQDCMLDLKAKLNCVRECINKFLEKHPGHREEYELIRNKVESEFHEPKIGDR